MNRQNRGVYREGGRVRSGEAEWLHHYPPLRNKRRGRLVLPLQREPPRMLWALSVRKGRLTPLLMKWFFHGSARWADRLSRGLPPWATLCATKPAGGSDGSRQQHG